MTIKAKYNEVIVLDWNRENNSTNGNAVYSFTVVADEKVISGKTKADASFVYGLFYGPATLKNVTIGVTAGGRIYMYDAE